MTSRKERANRIPVVFENLSESSKRSWTIPEYYEDEWYNCVDCGVKSLFSAETQKAWYEAEKRYFFQRPVRCQNCYEIWRKQKESKLYMDKELAKLRGDPQNQTLMKECAFAIIMFHQETGKGNLALGLHLLRSLKGRNLAIERGVAYCRSNENK